MQETNITIISLKHDKENQHENKTEGKQKAKTLKHRLFPSLKQKHNSHNNAGKRHQCTQDTGMNVKGNASETSVAALIFYIV